MDEIHRDAFRNCLDRAIARVAADWYDQLQHDWEGSSSKHVKNALTELSKLSAGGSEIPHYGPWEVPFYVTWYQPKQINLIYKCLYDYLPYFSRINRRLHLIDYGCGAHPLNFAVVALLMDRQDLDICIHAIDSSGPMLEIGRKVWDCFGFEAVDFPLIRKAYSAIGKKVLRYSTIKEFLQLSPEPSDHYCLLAFHSIYSSNSTIAREEFRELRRKLDPQPIIVTSNQARGDVVDRVLRDVVSDGWFSGEEYRRTVGTHPVIFTGLLETTTEWRREILRSIRADGWLGEVDDYLDREVPSSPTNWHISIPPSMKNGELMASGK